MAQNTFSTEPEHPKKYIVLVGACYIDTILETPHFPEEDSKLRATSIAHRRGGNGPNSAEVLAQLAIKSRHDRPQQQPWKPLLISQLPDKGSTDYHYIKESLAGVDISHCISREGQTEAARSYIIRSKANSSRTIVNYNGLDEMTFDEFAGTFTEICRKKEVAWWHFEGRNVEVVARCIELIRDKTPRVGISVEVEKPGREGLVELSHLALTVFYSRSWAMDAGYTNLKEFLENRKSYYELQGEGSQVGRIFCTWGEDGAGTVGLGTGEPVIIKRPQLTAGVRVLDTVGAGDVFIAGLLGRAVDTSWGGMSEDLRFAVELASRKVCQEGFGGL